MNKVLIIGEDFYGYNDSYASVFRSLGYEVRICYTHAWGVDSLIDKIICMVYPKHEKYVLDRKKKNIDAHLNEEYDKFEPDFVLILKGSMISVDTVKKMRQQSVVSLVATDSFENTYGGLDIAENVNFCYAFEGTDVKKYAEIVPTMKFMPIGYDDSQYYITENNKDIDVCFVGNGDSKRIAILKNLIRDFPDLRMEFYGIRTSRKRFWQYLLFKLHGYEKYFKESSLTHEEINQLYSRSKICINIQKDQSIDGWNARTNEILGAGGFEIVSSIPGIEAEYKDCLITFNTYGDLKKEIVYYLQNEKKRVEIAINGHALAVKKHTFRKNVERIVTDWQSVI